MVLLKKKQMKDHCSQAHQAQHWASSLEVFLTVNDLKWINNPWMGPQNTLESYPDLDPETKGKNHYQLHGPSSKHSSTAPFPQSLPQPKAQQRGSSLGEKGKLVQMQVVLPHKVWCSRSHLTKNVKYDPTWKLSGPILRVEDLEKSRILKL